MTDGDRYGGFTPARATRFYIPLLLQAFSQSLTYPLVAAIVAHGTYGVQELAAFAQGQAVMFMIGALGGGLVMTGMVFGRTRMGYRAFRRLNAYMMGALLSVQIFLALPPFGDWIFAHFLNLPPNLAVVGRQTLLWGVFMQAAFFFRNVPLVALFNARASFEANVATTIRIALTAVTPYVFIHLGWTGWAWGLAATTVPCFVEWWLTRQFARKYVRELPDAEPTEPSAVSDQFHFTWPLSLGAFLLAVSPLMIAVFVGRTENHVAMLAVHYVTIGLANPVGYAALRMQPVSIQFPPEYAGDTRMVRYAICAGLILGVIPLLTALPGVSDWYFSVVQNLPTEDVSLARTVMLGYAVWPVVQCLRGLMEGRAAWLKRPKTVFAGQVTYLTTLTVVLAVALACGLPGWTMGGLSILLATLATLVTVTFRVRSQT